MQRYCGVGDILVYRDIPNNQNIPCYISRRLNYFLYNAAILANYPLTVRIMEAEDAFYLCVP